MPSRSIDSSAPIIGFPWPSVNVATRYFSSLQLALTSSVLIELFNLVRYTAV
ncbi:hypothetical protein [Methanobrevibacter ruminantium]|nr:hypothetical protein [Methanobrevibacter ruminantium]